MTGSDKHSSFLQNGITAAKSFVMQAKAQAYKTEFSVNFSQPCPPYDTFTRVWYLLERVWAHQSGAPAEVGTGLAQIID